MSEALLQRKKRDPLMAEKKNRPKATKPSRATKQDNSPASIAQQVGELAWMGQHAQAVELATAALAAKSVDVRRRLALLDLRAESFIALGDLDQAEADATAMLVLAKHGKVPAYKAQAASRLALVQMRRGQFKTGVATANTALRAARLARQPALEAMALFRLGEAQFRALDNEAAVQNAGKAAAIYRSLGDPVGEGRATWVIATALSNLGRAADCDRAASDALALGQRCGDLYGIGNALNMRTFTEADIGISLKRLSQAQSAFEAAGYLERQAMITTNLGVGYRALGLYRRARRLFQKAGQMYRRTGARDALVGNEWQLALGEIAMGHLDSARSHIATGTAMDHSALDNRRAKYMSGSLLGMLAMREGHYRVASRLFTQSTRVVAGTGLDAFTMNSMARQSQAHLKLGHVRAALIATRSATKIHRTHELATIQGLDPELVWFRHSEALAANGHTVAAREALETAYGFMCKGIAGLGDEGLRRNYLNKIDFHREIVAAWLKDARTRRLAPERRRAHLTGETSLREPFERLVDTGLRLNELRSSTELHEFLIDEATELSGAERVLLVIETPAGLQLAGSLVPQGEDVQMLLKQVAPSLQQVRRARAASLAYTPEGVSELEQRSHIIAPLIAQRQILGYLYVDIDGMFGRFRDADRDLLGMLASQAAVALDNAQWSQGLEQKVAERTDELQASNVLLEQRAAELSIINAVQQALAGELSMQGVYDAVGDKLREVFGGALVLIRTYDPNTGMESYPYVCSVTGRRTVPPAPLFGFGIEVIRTGQTLLVNENLAEEAARRGSRSLVDNVEFPKSQLMVPMLSGGQVRGIVQLNDMEREHAYSASDVRLLETLAASMSVALQNARLFDETQRLFKESEQRAAELAIISAVQQALAGKLDMQGIYDVVGDKLGEIFHHADVGIRIHDPQTNLVHYPYSTDRGKRITIRSAPMEERGFFWRVLRTREMLVINEDMPQVAAKFHTHLLYGNEMPKSMVLVPLVIGKLARGTIDLTNMDREHAFSDSDVRMLQTLAGSMSVALENARLFDETQRLLKETERRSAELAVINTIQQGMAGELEFQAIIDLVGDKLRDVFSSDDISIHWVDKRTSASQALYVVERGERKYFPPFQADLSLPMMRALARGETVLARNRAEIAQVMGLTPETVTQEVENFPGTHESLTIVWVPIATDSDSMAALVLESADREDAFGENDLSLLRTVAASMGIALQNARLFKETQEALARQTASAEILRVISSSPTDASQSSMQS